MKLDGPSVITATDWQYDRKRLQGAIDHLLWNRGWQKRGWQIAWHGEIDTSPEHHRSSMEQSHRNGHQQRTWTERDHHCSSTLLNHSCIWLQMGFWLAHTHQGRREIGCQYQALDGKLGVWSLVMYCSCPSQFSTVLEPSKVSDEAVFVVFLQLVHCVLGCSFYPL